MSRFIECRIWTTEYLTYCLLKKSNILISGKIECIDCSMYVILVSEELRYSNFKCLFLGLYYRLIKSKQIFMRLLWNVQYVKLLLLLICLLFRPNTNCLLSFYMDRFCMWLQHIMKLSSHTLTNIFFESLQKMIIISLR